MENTFSREFPEVIYRVSYGFVHSVKIRVVLKDSEFLPMQSSGSMKSGTHLEISNLKPELCPSPKKLENNKFSYYLRVNFRQLWQKHTKEREELASLIEKKTKGRGK